MDIVSPEGFLYSVAKAQIKYPDRYDLALIYSKKPSQIAGVFTTNQIKAAPVKICMKRIRSGWAQVVVLNSGNANACTGQKGIEDALKITNYLAEKLNTNKQYIFPLSTGVIGMPLPVDRILNALDELIKNLGNAQPIQVAEAIMTTDTFPKLTFRQIKTASPLTILGICKGAGMISPNMATMLCTILTDAKISSDLMNEALRDAVAQSFNSITVDGDMSTNDTVLILANGESNIKIERKTALWKEFKSSLNDLCLELSQMIVRDGEGTTKFVTVIVKGAKTTQDAKRVARAVANSLLVKTAFYGNDPNWGRIIAAVGYSGIPVKEEKTEIYINGICLFQKGLPTMKEEELKKSLIQKEIEVLINLNSGKGQAKIFTTDLSEEYVKINSAYRT